MLSTVTLQNFVLPILSNKLMDYIINNTKSKGLEYKEITGHTSLPHQ